MTDSPHEPQQIGMYSILSLQKGFFCCSRFAQLKAGKKTHGKDTEFLPPVFNGCFSWMIPNLYIQKWLEITKYPLKKRCLGFIPNRTVGYILSKPFCRHCIQHLRW